MSIEKGESLMADMPQARAPHADRERTRGNPARRAVVLVGHGGVPRDYPRERLTQLRGLEAKRRVTKAPPSPEEVALETELRQWPRTPATDPCQAGVKSRAAHLRPLLEPARLVVSHVDLQRFMGDWYVIANIPTFVETDAYNAVESYRLDADGTIATTFTFRQGSYDGVLKSHYPRGFVLDTHSNAVWGMQFIWPFKGDFRIVYLQKVPQRWESAQPANQE